MQLSAEFFDPHLDIFVVKAPLRNLAVRLDCCLDFLLEFQGTAVHVGHVDGFRIAFTGVFRENSRQGIDSFVDESRFEESLAQGGGGFDFVFWILAKLLKIWDSLVVPLEGIQPGGDVKFELGVGGVIFRRELKFLQFFEQFFLHELSVGLAGLGISRVGVDRHSQGAFHSAHLRHLHDAYFLAPAERFGPLVGRLKQIDGAAFHIGVFGLGEGFSELTDLAGVVGVGLELFLGRGDEDPHVVQGLDFLVLVHQLFLLLRDP